MENRGLDKSMELKNKKGIFYTATVILLIALFLISFTIFEDVQNRKSIQKRVSTMNNFLASTEKDISRKVYVISYRTLFLLEKQVTEKTSYVSNFDSLFQEAFFNSSLNNVSQDVLFDVTKGGANYSIIKKEVEELGKQTNIDITLSNPRLNVTQTDPWNIKVTLIVNIYMRDRTGLASWNKTSYIDSYIPITNFEDPLYYVSTNGLFTNKITKTPFVCYAGLSPLNVSNLTSQVINSYYKESKKAPNFISRFKGLIGNNDSTGIESLVNVQNISLQLNKSVVDYVYFNTTLNPAHFGVNGTPWWFRLDQNHLADYNISAGMYY